MFRLDFFLRQNIDNQGFSRGPSVFSLFLTIYFELKDVIKMVFCLDFDVCQKNKK
jgi:hypothetical protein